METDAHQLHELAQLSAPQYCHREVRRELQQAGFRRVRLESYTGGHEVNAAHVTTAPGWFRP